MPLTHGGFLQRLGAGIAGSLVLWCAPATLSSQAGPETRPDSQTVVFVCEHGTVKSVIALAYFRQLVQERRLNIRAISRGTAPDSAVPVRVREGLRLDGLLLGPFSPVRFTLADLASAITVVSFDQPSVADIVGGRVPTARWDGLPAASEDYRIARDSIRHRVARLVDSLDRVRRGEPRPPGDFPSELEQIRGEYDEVTHRAEGNRPPRFAHAVASRRDDPTNQ
jgi:arsenate reductase